VFVLLSAAAFYVNSVGNGFVHDDTLLIEANPRIRTLASVPDLFGSDYLEGIREVGLYRPLVLVSFALNHAAGGGDPRGYHLVNVALHALVSTLVWLLFRMLPASPAVAVAGALLFAAHAIHTEAVANVAGRAELLTALFFLGALLCHVGGTRAPGRRGVLYGLGLLFYLLALFSKENAITLLGVVLLYDVLFVEAHGESFRTRLGRTLRERSGGVYLGYIGVTLLYLVARYLALRDGGLLPPIPEIDNPLVALPFPARVLNALWVAWRYFYLLLFPLNLSYDYSDDQIPLLSSLLDLRTLGVLGLTLAAAWMGARSYRASKVLCFALGFYALTFSIVSNLFVQIGTIMGERLLYLPSVGFCLAVTLLLRALVERFPSSAIARRATYAGLIGLLVVAHAWRAIDRNADWHSNERLYVTDLEGARSSKLLNNGGWILIDQEIDVERGVALLERAVRRQPGQFEYLDSLGWGYYKLGEHEKARRILVRSLEIEDSGPSAALRRAHLRRIKEALRAAEARTSTPR
jgi:tetratricopeptide (TPR) repeat protein